MSKIYPFILAASIAIAGAGSAIAGGNQPSDYTVKELLNVCMEGANDARGGAVDELVCNQYLKAVSDTLILTQSDQGLCLPTADEGRPDKLSRAFIKWVYEDFERRAMQAAEGVIDALKSKFPCSK